MQNSVTSRAIGQKIYLIREQRVMLSVDLAKLYEIEPKYLTRQVHRNIDRFPKDFMFKLTKDEHLKCHNVTSSWGGIRRAMPYAFTEQGVAMLSSVLRSKRAIQVNITIMRAFVQFRQILSTHKELAHKLEQLERKTEKHDIEIQAIFEAIRQLMKPPKAVPKRKIGFHAK